MSLPTGNIRNRKGFGFKDFYQLLDIPRDADYHAVKRAYRRLAKEYHPDRNRAKLAGDHFRTLQEAYETLTDPAKRRRYDLWLDSGVTLALYRVWQQARDSQRRYRTAGFRRGRRSRRRFAPLNRGNLNWLVTFLLISMLLLSAYTFFVSLREMFVNGYKTEQLQGITFSAGFIVLLVIIGIRKYQ